MGTATTLSGPDAVIWIHQRFYRTPQVLTLLAAGHNGAVVLYLMACHEGLANQSPNVDPDALGFSPAVAEQLVAVDMFDRVDGGYRLAPDQGLCINSRGGEVWNREARDGMDHDNRCLHWSGKREPS